MTFGLSATGFNRKRLEDLKEEIESILKSEISENIDLRSESVFGQLVGTFVLPAAELWEETENVYVSYDPDFAEGAQLDAVAALTGSVRLPATRTLVTAIVSGAQGTVVPAGSQAENPETNEVFQSRTSVTISTSNAVRIVLSVNAVVALTDYTVTINGNAYTYTSSTAPDENEILEGLEAAIGIVDVLLVDSTLVLTSATPFTYAKTSNIDTDFIGSQVQFESADLGPVILPEGALSDILSLVSGWDGVTNPEAGVTGRARETDVNFRIRRRQTVAFPARSTVDAIFSKLAALADVDRVKVLQNNGTTTDANGTPPQHVWAILRGGDSQDIADILFQNVAGGIGYRGAEEVIVTSESGQDYVVKYDRPEEVDIYISIEIRLNEEAAPNVEDLIKEEIISFFQSNFDIGQAVKYSRIYTPINKVSGFEVTELFIGVAPSPSGMVSIPLDVDQIAITDEVKIVITVVT